MVHDPEAELSLNERIIQSNAESVSSHRFSNDAYDRFYCTSFLRAFFHLWENMGKPFVFRKKHLPVLQQPSSKVLRQAYHRLTLPKTCRLYSVVHVVEALVMEVLEKGELLGQLIKLTYQDEETEVTVNAVILLFAVHDQV